MNGSTCRGGTATISRDYCFGTASITRTGTDVTRESQTAVGSRTLKPKKAWQRLRSDLSALRSPARSSPSAAVRARYGRCHPIRDSIRRRNVSTKKAWQRPTLPRLSAAVPSAQEGLTSVFGMGTGGTPPLWSPGNCLLTIDNKLLGEVVQRQRRWPGSWLTPTPSHRMCCVDE